MKEEEHRFYSSKKMKIILFSLLIALNLVLRIPFYPHEYGADSFVIHILGNSVSEFGCAKWWVNPLSVVGLYPYSECSAVPFILSGISQTTGIDVEHVILLFCIILGLLTIFAAYILFNYHFVYITFCNASSGLLPYTCFYRLFNCSSVLYVKKPFKEILYIQ